MNKTWLEKNRLRLALGVAIVVGVFGVGIFSHQGFLPSQFMEHFYMALAVSALIALTLEVAMHERLAKNVFEAAVGYVLPPEIRGELGWIYGQQYLCFDSTLTVRLTPIVGTSLLQSTMEVTRVFKNISSETQYFQPSLGVEENLHIGHPTKILDYSVQVIGKAKETYSVLELEPHHPGIRICPDPKIIHPIPVRSHETFRVCFSVQKTFREQDSDYMHFGFPTTNVTVIVYVPDEFQAWVNFSNRGNDPDLVRTGPHTWKLTGVLLPLQGIRILWNRKDVFEEWKRTAIS